MSKQGKKFKYIENVVLEDYGLSLPDLAVAVTLAHGKPPPTKRRPFTENNEWKRRVGEFLRDAVPEASRAMAAGYTSVLVTYMMRAHLSFYGRLDNNYHEQVIYQVKAARKRARESANRRGDDDSAGNMGATGLRAELG